MKKRLFFVVFACLILALGTVRVYFQAGLPYTHDGENHVARFANYKAALREGQFPPRFAPYLLNGFGYPVFNFNYPLANIVSVPFTLIGISYESTFKIIVFIFLLAGSIGLWRLLGPLGKSSKMIGVLTWFSAPFLVSTLLFRGSIGELMIYGLLPGLLVATSEIAKFNTKKLWHIVIWSLFFLAHNVSVLWLTPLLIGYFMLVWLGSGRDRQRLVTFATVLLLSFGVTVWFWLPAMLELSQVVLSEAENTMAFSSHFPTVHQLLFGPVRFGFSYSGSVDTLSFALGLILVPTLIIFPIWFFTTGKHSSVSRFVRQLPWFWLVATMLIIFQTQNTQWFWQHMPFMRFIQFPWRLSLAIPLLGATLLAYMSDHISRKYRFLILCVLLLNWIKITGVKPVDFIHNADSHYDSFVLTTMTQNENSTKDFTYTAIDQNPRQPIIYSGSAAVSSVVWRGSNRTYTVAAHTPVQIIEPTMNFIGWETTANSEIVEYSENSSSAGRISYVLEPGTYQVSTRFTQKTTARRIGNTVSLFSVVWIGVSSALKLRTKRVIHV